MMDIASRDGREIPVFPTGKEKTRFEDTKEKAFPKTSTRHVGALYLLFSFNGLDKPSA